MRACGRRLAAPFVSFALFSRGARAETPPNESAAPGADARVDTPGPPSEPVEVTVRGKKSAPSASVTMTREQVRQMPGAFGDPFRAVEVLPGVTPIASGIPYFFVRGAPPGNVGYYLDGTRVPLLYHIGLGPSVIHPALVDRVELFAGGYPAEFGRFMGGIVVAETKPPAGVFHGEANVRLLDAGALVEAPFADGRGSALVGGRYSYTGLLLSAISPNTALGYWDYQSRVTYDVSADDRIRAFAFGSYDFTGQKRADRTETLFESQFHRLALRFDHRIGSRGTVRLDATAGYDRTAFGEGGNVRDRSIGIRAMTTYRLSDRLVLRGGSDATLDAYDIEAQRTRPGNINSDQIPVFLSLLPTRRDAALGAHFDFSYRPFDNWEVVPGLRVDFFSSRGNTAIGVDPRFATRITVSEAVNVIYAFGIAHQPPSYVVPLPGFQIGGLEGGLQWSAQSSGGVEWRAAEQLKAKFTLFENAYFEMTDALGTLHADSGTDTDFERRSAGRTIGAELMAEGQLGRGFSGFAAYTLSRSVRTVDRRTFLSSFDRTHNLNAALGNDLGRRWRAGVRLSLYSGLPSSEGKGERLAPFYRVDLRLEKRWMLADNRSVALTFELMNATFQKETLNTRCDAAGCSPVTIGPITLPSVGLEATF